ncbi:MAG: RNA-binding domain-containing protein [Pseudomonadota bacterium]
MDWNELIEKLNGFEWNDVEFKEAIEHCPKSAFESVSAFANTAGGWLIFGVKEDNGVFTIIGVKRLDQVASEFFSTLRSGNKCSFMPDVKESRILHEDKNVLTFYVPEAPRDAKPVYLHGDLRQTYIRKAGNDQRCSPKEIEQFHRNRSDRPYDSEFLDLNFEGLFDEETIKWYRSQWQPRNPDKLTDASTLDFLKYYGLIAEVGGKPRPTRAAVLLFGTEAAILSILPRPVADFRRIGVTFDMGIPDENRWEDRGVMECNLMTAWRLILEHYRKASDVPFSLDKVTLRREDRPPDYIAFREALINLLTHQDFGDQTRKASIQLFRDRMIFWNPGSSIVSREEMFTPGDRPVRNPRIVSAFQRIGLGEQAGTGMGAIYSNWRQLKRIPPMIENDKSGHSFCLHLLGDELVSEEQLLFQAKLGVHLSEDEAALFSQVWRQGQIWPLEARAITGRSGTETIVILKHLVVQNLVELRKGQHDEHYVLAPHLREILHGKSPQPEKPIMERSVTIQPDASDERLVTDTAKPLKRLTETQRKIVLFCDQPKPIAQIMRYLDVSNRTFLRRTHLSPLIEAGVLRLTMPDNPNHPRQAYVLTDTGLDLKKKLDAGEKSK